MFFIDSDSTEKYLCKLICNLINKIRIYKKKVIYFLNLCRIDNTIRIINYYPIVMRLHRDLQFVVGEESKPPFWMQFMKHNIL